MEPRAGIRVLSAIPRLARAGLAVAALALAAPAARAQVFLTQEQALQLAFPGARIERRASFLTEEQARAVERLARVKLPTRLTVVYCGFRGDTLEGAAFFDQRVVRTMPGVFMVVVGPDTSVRRVDVLAFHEPPDYRPPARWLGLFPPRRLDDELWPRRGIRNISGATLTARSVTESVRTALALYQVLFAPPGATAPAPEAR